MAQCDTCDQKAVFSSPTLCKNHFISYVEDKVRETITRFNLVEKKDKLAVAVSGGKDSQTVLYLLHKFFGNTTAIAIDEGILGYRDETLKDMKIFCDTYDIPLQIYSFKEAYGQQLTTFLEKGAPACRSCGVLRRHLLNAHASEFDKIATGHNLDDEIQSIVMNLLKGNLFLSAKLGPESGITKREGFTQRIKPLYLCTEKEIATYAFLKGFPVKFTECPHASLGFRSKVRDAINDVEIKSKGVKQHMVENFLEILPKLKKLYQGLPLPSLCMKCKSPSTTKLCKACKTLEVYVHAN